MFVCIAGDMTTRKARIGKKNQNKKQTLTFYFDVEKCKICTMSEGCYSKGAISKTYSVSIQSKEHDEQSVFQETDTFKKRYKIEEKIVS